jgi:hypothetical protein
MFDPTAVVFLRLKVAGSIPALATTISPVQRRWMHYSAKSSAADRAFMREPVGGVAHRESSVRCTVLVSSHARTSDHRYNTLCPTLMNFGPVPRYRFCAITVTRRSA